jgi:hypothetical protein
VKSIDDEARKLSTLSWNPKRCSNKRAKKIPTRQKERIL